MRRSFQRFFRTISELGIVHVSSSNYLLLRLEQALNAHGSIAAGKKGCVLSLYVSFHPCLAARKLYHSVGQEWGYQICGNGS